MKKCFGCKVETLLSEMKFKFRWRKNIIVDPRLAYQITSMMEGVIERGTARKLRDLNVPIAGKPGQQIRIKMCGLSVIHLI